MSMIYDDQIYVPEKIKVTHCSITADITAINLAFKEAEKKIKEFSKKIKDRDKKKEDKLVDFNKFLRTLCKRKKK